MHASIWEQLVALLVQNQLAVYAALSAVLTSGVVWIAARRVPGFAGLGKTPKTIIAAIAAVIVTIAVQVVGGTPDAGLSLAGIIFGSGLAFGTATPIVKMVKTQPSSNIQFEHLQDTGKLPPRVGG